MHCTVVTGWWYCYYPVSGTRPHYEWVGFFEHHDGVKSFVKDHLFLYVKNEAPEVSVPSAVKFWYKDQLGVAFC